MNWRCINTLCSTVCPGAYWHLFPVAGTACRAAFSSAYVSDCNSLLWFSTCINGKENIEQTYCISNAIQYMMKRHNPFFVPWPPQLLQSVNKVSLLPHPFSHSLKPAEQSLTCILTVDQTTFHCMESNISLPRLYNLAPVDSFSVVHDFHFGSTKTLNMLRFAAH